MRTPVEGRIRSRLLASLRGWRLAWRITKLNFRARLEYRVEFLMMAGLGAVWQMSVLVFATVLLTQFPGMGDWANTEVLLLASMRLLSHGFYVLFLGRMSATVFLVQEGRVDSYLIRPMPVYRQMQLAFFHVNAVGDLAVAISLFAVALVLVDVSWTVGLIVYLLLALIGGVLMDGAMFTVFSSIALHAPATVYWSEWVDELMTAYGNYPLHIMPSLVRDSLTFLLPLAFVAYLPAAVITGNVDTLAVPAWLAYLAPAVGLAAFVAARALWRTSLRYYKGVGTV